jgi:hypothetical protein
VIRRAPRPKHSYTVIRDDVLRDPNLSYRASGVLDDILSRPDNWTATAESLAAARPGKEGVKALRTALRELEKAGYLKRERVRCDDGRFDWAQTVYDTPRSDTSATEPNVSAGQTISPKPPGGFPPGGNRPSKEVPRRSTEKNEVKWPNSGRSAPSVGDDEHDHASDVVGEVAESIDFAERRANDRALFKSFVGERIASWGAKEWSRGVFSTDEIYDVLRTKGIRRKAIDNPGAYLARVCEGPSPAGLVNWLDEQGFELVDHDLPAAA